MFYEVRYCNEHNIRFLAQARGNGWADTFDLGRCGLLINLAGLDMVTLNIDKTMATIQAAASVQDMVNVTYTNDIRFANPTCNCLGYLGSSLRRGLNRATGVYGAGVDQITSLSLVLASGQSVQVSAKNNQDLWFAVRGAAANFGIVTSAVVKVYPTPQAHNTAWEAAITFSDDKLESLIDASHDLNLTEFMQVDLLFSNTGPPHFALTITVVPFFLGSVSEAQDAFASILRLGPLSNTAQETPYSQWEAFADLFCTQGGRKPTYGASISREGFVPSTWRAIYEQFKAFVIAHPEACQSSILAEYYPEIKAPTVGDSTPSYPPRDTPIHVVAIPWYDNATLDDEANGFGSRIRELLRSTQGIPQNSSYVYRCCSQPLVYLDCCILPRPLTVSIQVHNLCAWR